MAKKFLLTISSAVFLILLSACGTTDKPVKPMIFASAAMKAADRARAEKLAPDIYRRAEVKYWAAKTDFLQRNFEAAEKNATEAKRLYEKAEMKASLQALEESEDD